MKDRIDTQRPRMTEGERQRVWERVRQQTTSASGHGAGDSAVDAAGRSESPFSHWFTGRRFLTPMAVGAMATVVFAVVIWDRAAEHEADLDRIRDRAISSAGTEEVTPQPAKKDADSSLDLKSEGQFTGELMEAESDESEDNRNLPIPAPAPTPTVSGADVSENEGPGDPGDADDAMSGSDDKSVSMGLGKAVESKEVRPESVVAPVPESEPTPPPTSAAPPFKAQTQSQRSEETRSTSELPDTRPQVGSTVGGESGRQRRTADSETSPAETEAARFSDSDSRLLAELGTIEGVVTDTLGNPIPFANVMLVGTQLGAVALEDGRFKVVNVPPGVYDVRASSMGFSMEIAKNVEVSSGKGPSLSFAMEPKSVGWMSEIAVTAEKERIAPTGKSTTVRRPASREPLPVDEVAEAIGLKAGVVAKDEEVLFRGGRAGEANPSAPANSEQKFDDSSRRVMAEPSGSVPQSTSRDKPQFLGLQTPGESNEPYDLVIYQDYGSNPLTFADTDPFSTFAVDVDNGSYTVARRYVTDGYLPEPASVRVEEFVNFFDPGYPEFHGPDFRIFVDGAEAPYGDGFHLLRVGLKARTVPDAERKPANLTFVVDISGSMSREDRLGLVRTSLEQLVDGLRPSDRVSLVVYGSRAEVLLRGTQVAKKDRILESIGRLQSAGSTNAEDGLRLGYEMAREMFDPEANNRIILCSDGVANVGRTGPNAILEVVRSEADKGVYLTTVGFGMGNYNDVLMEQLADQGDGAYYYVDRLDEADRIFRRELTGTLEVVGQDAKIQVEFDPRKVDGYRLIGFENRDVADRDFRNDDIDAGEIGSGHTVVALYEVRLQDDVHVDDTLATVRFRYAKPATQAGQRPKVTELEQDVRMHQVVRSVETQAPRLQLAAVVAEYAEILRHSFWAQNRDLQDLVPVANEMAGRLNEDPDVTEFSRLVWKAAEIQDRMTEEEKARRWPHLRADLPGYPDRW